MLNLFARAHVSRVTDPVGRWLVARGVSPDAVTVAGTVGTAAAAVWFMPRGQLFLGALAGHRLRAVRPDRRRDGAGPGQQHAVRRGARLHLRPHRGRRPVRRDSPGGAWPAARQRARRRRTGLPGRGAGDLLHQGAGRGRGAHRGRRPRRARRAADRRRWSAPASRGSGIPYALAVALWLLAAASVWTVGQRIAAVHRSARALDVRRSAT